MTDSSVQLTPEEVEKYDITVVPLTITIDGKSYVDGIDITRSDFVKKMNEAESLPKTSQPPIGRFVDVIKKLTADGSQVIGIFLAKSLSGTIDAARQAAEIAGQSDNVTIIDSELTDRAEGFKFWLLLRMLRLVKAWLRLLIMLKRFVVLKNWK